MTRRISIVTILLLLMTGLMASNFALPAVAQTSTNASADDFIPEIPLPGLFEGPQKMNNNLMANYVRAMFVYFVWVVGIVATVMVIYGGIKWVAAAGNPGQIKDARDIIDSAIIGVIIALVSVVLLNIINPKLASLNIAGLNPIKKTSFSTYTTKVCPIDLEVLCGQTKVIGNTTSPEGIPVDEYCIGTMHDGKGIASSNKNQACVLTYDRVAKSYTKGEERESMVPILKLVAGKYQVVMLDHAHTVDYSGDKYFPAGTYMGLFFHDQGIGKSTCGDVVRPWSVLGDGAPEIGLRQARTDELGFCYQNGEIAVYDPSRDWMTNVCWPGDSCPLVTTSDVASSFPG